MRNHPRLRIPLHLYRRHRAYRPETRQQMIDSTNRFLSWALGPGGPGGSGGPRGRGVRHPRIPRRRVDRGGFSTILRMHGAQAMARDFWRRVLSMTPWE
jgi:hypothetical protein